MKTLTKIWNGFLFAYGSLIWLGAGAFFIALSIENPGFLLIPLAVALYYARNHLRRWIVQGFSILLMASIAGGIIALLFAFPLPVIAIVLLVMLFR